MIENGKLTLLDIEELCKKVHEFSVEFTITIHPDSAEVTLSPWQPTTMSTDTKVEPVQEPRVLVTSDKFMTTEEIKAEAERIKQEMKNMTTVL